MQACFQASEANFLGESGSIMNPAHEFDEMILLLELKNPHIRTSPEDLRGGRLIISMS